VRLVGLVSWIRAEWSHKFICLVSWKIQARNRILSTNGPTDKHRNVTYLFCLFATTRNATEIATNLPVVGSSTHSAVRFYLLNIPILLVMNVSLFR